MVWCLSSTLGTSWAAGETFTFTNLAYEEGGRSFLNVVSDSTIATMSMFLALSTGCDVGGDGGVSVDGEVNGASSVSAKGEANEGWWCGCKGGSK